MPQKGHQQRSTFLQKVLFLFQEKKSIFIPNKKIKQDYINQLLRG